MKLRDEYFVLTRDAETGKVVKMTRLPVPQIEFYDESQPVSIRPMAMEEA